MANSTPALNWTILKFRGQVPVNRLGAAHCAVGDKQFVYGGLFKKGNETFFLNDAWYIECKDGKCLWVKLSDPPRSFGARAYHSATLIGDTIWIIGGRTKRDLHDNALVVYSFNTVSLEWKAQTIRGSHWLKRYSHVAVQLTLSPHKILIFGGYHPLDTDQPPLLLLNTTTYSVETFQMTGVTVCRRASAIPVQISETAILFVGGVHPETEKPVTGFACMFLEQNLWTENHTSYASWDGLIGARCVQYGNTFLIHGGHLRRDDGDIPAEILELTIDRQRQGCWQQNVQNKNLIGLKDHVLFVHGNWICACHGVDSESVNGVTLHCADLSVLGVAKSSQAVMTITTDIQKHVTVMEKKQMKCSKKEDSVYDLTERSEVSHAASATNGISSADSRQRTEGKLTEQNTRGTGTHARVSTHFCLDQFLADISDRRLSERHELERAIQNLESKLLVATKQNLILEEELRDIKEKMKRREERMDQWRHGVAKKAAALKQALIGQEWQQSSSRKYSDSMDPQMSLDRVSPQHRTKRHCTTFITKS